MTLGQTLAAELKHEAVSTRKMLERVPEDKFDWQPHEKSMKLGRLASHVAEISHWVNAALTQDELDFATSDYKPETANSARDLVEIFDKTVGEAAGLLENVSDEDIMRKWRLRNGEKIFFELPKIAVIRSMVLNHLIHHRGQLSVYLRLNDVPLPSVYGPTADEPMM
ncbi:MAG TPA: DinB family protein [Pyrinomonadaceae bacterium]|nr:DinB family protein [Pyrinomonadaceae bacterium]